MNDVLPFRGFYALWKGALDVGRYLITREVAA